MSARQPAIDGLIFANKIALIHKAARDFNMEDADYRALLLRTAGVTSSQAITVSKFPTVMAEFIRLGFVSAPAKRKPKAAGGTAENRPTASQWTLLEYRARAVGYSGLEDPRFIAWMQPRAHVAHPRFMDATAIQRVLAALGSWIQRKAKRASQ